MEMNLWEHLWRALFSAFSDLSHEVSEMSKEKNPSSSHDDREKPLKRDLNETLKEWSNMKDPLCVYTHVYVDLYINIYK